MTSPPTLALVPRDQSRDHRLALRRKEPEWQRLWLSLEAETWNSVAIVPTGHLSSIELVHGLASVAWQQRGSRIIVADLQAIALPALSAARLELRRRVDAGDRVLIALQSLDSSPTAAAIARDADKVLLCVHVSATTTVSLREAIKQLGRQRLLGAITVRDT